MNLCAFWEKRGGVALIEVVVEEEVSMEDF
jgi:hypothetical protein